MTTPPEPTISDALAHTAALVAAGDVAVRTGQLWRTAAIKLLNMRTYPDRGALPARYVRLNINDYMNSAITDGMSAETAVAYVSRTRRMIEELLGTGRRRAGGGADCPHGGLVVAHVLADGQSMTWCGRCGGLRIGSMPWFRPVGA